MPRTTLHALVEAYFSLALRALSGFSSRLSYFWVCAFLRIRSQNIGVEQLNVPCPGRHPRYTSAHSWEGLGWPIFSAGIRFAVVGVRPVYTCGYDLAYELAYVRDAWLWHLRGVFTFIWGGLGGVGVFVLVFVFLFQKEK